ncbi:caspase, EACC1-associated type [Streptomyces sp. S6]
MAEDTAALLSRLMPASGDDIDVRDLLDAVLLASAWSHPTSGLGNTSLDPAPVNGQDEAEAATPADDAQTPGDEQATDVTHEPAASVWLADETSTHHIPGKQVSLGRATALPDVLAIGRALRPLRRPWLSGVHQRLDIDATVEHYARTRILAPRFAPAPEPWLEVILVLDRGTAMAVWDETVRALTRTLRALAAFRNVRVWHLDHPPGGTPVLCDHHGRALPMDPDDGHYRQPARRLLLVITDCAAPVWRQDALWQTLHAWGRTAPVALINPLPKRLWQRSGLDFPYTTATATTPASPGRLLSYRRPRLLRETPETKPWQALPVLQFDPAQIHAWARTLMRTDPSGCEAVLTPATGRPPLRRHRPDPVPPPDAVLSQHQALAFAEAFTDDRQSPAVRLALAATPLDSFTLPVLDVLRDRLVPDATLADTSEFLTAGLLTATRTESADTIYHFHPAAAAHLNSLLTRDQLWNTHFALSDHLATRIQAPHGIRVTLHSPDAAETVPTGLRPIAHATAATARLLGVQATEKHDTARSTTVDPQPAPASGMPIRGEDKKALVEALLASPMNYSRGTFDLWLESIRLVITPNRLTQIQDSGTTKGRIISLINYALSQSSPQILLALADALDELGDSPASATVRRLIDQTVDVWHINQRSGIESPYHLSNTEHVTLDSFEARYALVISVDVQRFATHNDAEQRRIRTQLYRVLETALVYANVPRDAVQIEDRGDGVLMLVAVQVPASRLLGPWLVEVNEKLREENRSVRTPLRLRIGMHVGTVQQDARGISGHAVTLACRLSDSIVVQGLLKTKADLVVLVSQSLYEDVVSSGGRFIEAAQYFPTRLQLKQGEVTAWLHLPGLPTPKLPSDVPKFEARSPSLKRPREMPDLATSRAVFVGVGSYESPHLPPLPSAPRGAAAVRRMLTSQQPDACFTEESTRLLIDPADPRDVLRAVQDAAQDAQDTLLVYYAGHSLVSLSRGTLLLTTTTTEQGSEFTAIFYDSVREILATSSAKRSVVILDCCYSGRAMRGVTKLFSGTTGQASTYVLAATSADMQALAPPDEQYPRFTTAFLDLLTAGEPEGPALWTMEEIHQSLTKRSLPSLFPQPILHSSNTETSVALARNPAGRESTRPPTQQAGPG